MVGVVIILRDEETFRYIKHQSAGVQFKTMPAKAFRLLIAMLLALAVPLQGFAAAAAAVCAAMDSHAATVSVAGHGDGHSHDSHLVDTDGKTGSHHSGSDKSPDKGHCAPCVAAAVISSFDALHIPELPAAAVIAVMPASFSGIAPETLDRPPLSL